VKYELWDVFTTEPFAGNPLAVVPDASGLSDAQMQRVANEFNLSETSFVLPSSTADVRARYFTPAFELPMAGHPSVGTVFALDKMGVFAGRDEATLELTIGPVQMTLERDGKTLRRVWMNQGVPQLLETFDRTRVARALGLSEADLESDLPVQLGSAGNTFLLVPVVSLGALARVRVSPAELSRLLPEDFRAVFIFTRNAPESDIRARIFSVTYRIDEDPATGSAHGPLGAYLAAHTDILQGERTEFITHQGVEMGRKSELFVRLERLATGVQVSVGGAAVKVGEGRLFL
jgi:trans-2,3-dihydro-3-hydroxyanthranilate isomerase